MVSSWVSFDINEFLQLFVKYNIHFSGVSRSIFRTKSDHLDGQDFSDLVSQIVSMSFDSVGLHWRYKSNLGYLCLIYILLSLVASFLKSNTHMKVTLEVVRGKFNCVEIMDAIDLKTWVSMIESFTRGGSRKIQLC